MPTAMTSAPPDPPRIRHIGHCIYCGRSDYADGETRKLAMAGGSETISVPAGAHVVIDPMAKLLRRSVAIEQYQAWRDAQARRPRPTN